MREAADNSNRAYHFGWYAAPIILTPAGLLGLASAFGLQRMLIVNEGVERQ